MLMIPLSYAATLGGTITLIGTSTNLVINGQYQALTGEPGFGLFDISAIGIPAAIIGAGFCYSGDAAIVAAAAKRFGTVC